MARLIVALWSLLVVVVYLNAQPVYAVRYAQCDQCGLCEDTTKSKQAPTKSIYIQPSNWYACASCVYGDAFSGSTVTPVPCITDEQGREVEFLKPDGTPVDASLVRCDTLLMSPIPMVTPGTNQPALRPQSGRMYSDLGCLNVAAGTFLSPDASIDVVNKLLSLILSITGGVGFMLIIASTFRLIVSRGDPDKIREARKALINVIIGVLFALFSLFIIRFIAADVLRIPGFTS